MGTPILNPLFNHTQVESEHGKEADWMDPLSRCLLPKGVDTGAQNKGRACSSKLQVVPETFKPTGCLVWTHYHVITQYASGKGGAKWVSSERGFCCGMGGYSVTVCILLEVTVMLISLGDKCFFKITHM